MGKKETARKISYWIGIDPGENMGIAVWDSEDKAVNYATAASFWEAVEYIESVRLDYPDIHDGFRGYRPNIVFVLELPQLNKTTFSHGETDRRKRERISRNVGANHNDAKRIHEKIKLLGLPVITVQPKAKKASAEEVKVITGYTGKPNNEHVRDAIMHAYRECRRRGGMYYE